MTPSGPRLKKHWGGASLATHLARDIHVALTRGLVGSACCFRLLVQVLVMPAFGVLDWVDWTGISAVLVLVVLLALMWVWRHKGRD